jgi:hypothetical protein
VPLVSSRQNIRDRSVEQAAKELEEAEEIIVIGYSPPVTDLFFRNLVGLGTVGRKFIFAVIAAAWAGEPGIGLNISR